MFYSFRLQMYFFLVKKIRKRDPSVFFFEKGFFMSQKRVFFVKNIE